VWQKTKCVTTGEFVVIGTQPAGNGPACPRPARKGDQGLQYAGSAFVTLSGTQTDAFWRDMERLRCRAPAVPVPRPQRVSWVAPDVRVRARYLKGGEKLRHAPLVQLLDPVIRRQSSRCLVGVLLSKTRKKSVCPTPAETGLPYGAMT
jgi:ATP-dependent DNA ligase